jgi:hypothetical protein
MLAASRICAPPPATGPSCPCITSSSMLPMCPRRRPPIDAVVVLQSASLPPSSSSNRRHCRCRPPIPHGAAVRSSDPDPSIDAIVATTIVDHAISPSSSDPSHRRFRPHRRHHHRPRHPCRGPPIKMLLRHLPRTLLVASLVQPHTSSEFMLVALICTPPPPFTLKE